jgi:3',5'-cyclic AMP phosphodiesterase CpdA
MNRDPRIRFALFAGDLTTRGTADQLARFKREMKTLAFPVYATLGNHELGTRDDLFHDFFGRGSFSFAFRGARFTLVDSASGTVAPAVYRWLDDWLAAGAGGFHVVAMHMPPLDPVGYRNGGFASRLEASMLVSRLASGKVDLTLYGHIHSFYAFANAGIPAYISGGGGAIPERLDGIGRHFLTIDVDPASQLFQVAVVRVD